MDRLDMVIELVQEAKEERKRLEAMEKEIQKLAMPITSDYWSRRAEIENRYKPTPRKSVINDNLKTARRLLLREYVKEV